MTSEQKAAWTSAIGTAIGTALTAAAAMIAIYAINAQRYQTNAVLKAQMLREFTNDFRQEYMRKIRCKLAQFGRQRLDDKKNDSLLPHCPKPKVLPMQGYQLMDFFDVVGVYYKNEALDQEATFVTFFYWMHYYWEAFKDDIRKFQAEEKLAMYTDIEKMVNDLNRLSLKIKKRNIKEATHEELRKFFTNEIEETGPCEDAPKLVKTKHLNLP